VSYCHYWENCKPKPKFIPLPHIWLRDGDWKHPAPAVTRGIRETVDEALRKADEEAR
jgi:hypothetical protein